MKRVHAILLAAGESSRMGFPKPLLKLDGRTFIEHLTGRMVNAIGQMTIVLGAHRDRIRPFIPADFKITVVENTNYRNGQLSSLKTALRDLTSIADAVMVHLADHPLVRETSFRAIRERYEAGRKPIVIACYRGRRGHPVVFDRSLFEEILCAPEDQGARTVVNADPARVDCFELDDSGVALDLDTPEELESAGLEAPTGIERTGIRLRR